MHADMKVLALSAEGVFKSHLAVMLRISMKLNALFPPNKKKTTPVTAYSTQIQQTHFPPA